MLEICRFRRPSGILDKIHGYKHIGNIKVMNDASQQVSVTLAVANRLVKRSQVEFQEAEISPTAEPATPEHQGIQGLPSSILRSYITRNMCDSQAYHIPNNLSDL